MSSVSLPRTHTTEGVENVPSVLLIYFSGDHFARVFIICSRLGTTILPIDLGGIRTRAVRRWGP